MSAPLNFNARIHSDQLNRDITAINRQIGRISSNMQKESREIDAITGRIGRGLAGAFSVFATGNFIKDIAKVRGEFQQLEVAFETMLGSKAKADQLMAEVVQFAARTPFELSEVAAGTKQLIAYGIAADDILPTLKGLGDVSAGLSVPIERLILNYGQVRTQLKMTGRELRDFQVAGVPIVAELAKQLDVAESKVQDMVSAGEIGFEQVEKAFRSMTDEGGRFNDLMDKQAKTITGLASNFQDAWDRMLNSIGEENQGIIVNSIKGATELVENYEEVIKILKVLVTTYGAYKAAVIATAVVQRSMAFADNIRLVAMYRKELGLATAAQQAFNTASKANPYGLALAAIASLVSILTVYNSRTDEAAEASATFSKSLSDEKKAIEQAFAAITKAKDGTKERAQAIQTVNDKYREYLPNLLTEADNLYQVEKAQNAVTEAVAKTLAFKAQEDALTKTQSNVDKALNNFYEQINDAAKKLNDAQKGQFTALIEGYKESLRQQFESLGYFPEFTMNRINEIFEGITGKDLGGWAIGDLDMALKGLIRSEIELEEKTEGLKTTYEEYLKALGIGQAPPEPQVLTTINEKIEETKTLLDEARQKLTDLRSPESTAGIDDIQNQEKRVKELESTLETLTGVSKKAQQIIEQSHSDRLKALADFADQELTLERDLQSSKIAIMQQGADRRKAEAELQYQREIDRISEQQRAYLEAWNASQGYEPGDIGFISELPEQEIERFTQLRVNAEARKNQQIEQINRETANEIESIWKDVNDSFLSGVDADIAAIDAKYDRLVERAKQAGETNLKAISDAREKEKQEVYINADLEKLQFQEQIELQRAEISTQGFNREIEVERKKLEIVKKFARQKIDILKKSGAEESQQEIEQLELFIKASDQGLNELNKKTLTESISKVSAMVDEFKNLSDEIFGADTQLSSILGGLGEMGDSFARIAAGDYSGAVSLLTSILKMSTDTTNVENRLSKPWEEFEQWIAASNRELQRYIELRDEAIGWDRYSSSNDALLQITEDINTAKQKLAEMQLSFTLEGSGWFAEPFNQINAQIAELKEKMGGVFDLEDTSGIGAIGIWNKVKRIYSYDLNQLLFDEAGEFTISKINELIKEGTITDQAVIDAVDYYEDLIGQLTAAERQKQELLTATMADNIADGIISGFREGYDSASDFAETFENLMKDAIFNALKIQALEEPLKEWYRQFAAYSESGGVLTAAEIAELENSYNSIVENAMRQFDEMKRLSNLDFTGEFAGREGLTGAIKGITEETAGLIAGQFTAMREIGQKSYLTGLEQLDSINQSVEHLANIEENTRYNKHLVEIRDDIKQMNNYLKDAI